MPESRKRRQRSQRPKSSDNAEANGASGDLPVSEAEAVEEPDVMETPVVPETPEVLAAEEASLPVTNLAEPDHDVGQDEQENVAGRANGTGVSQLFHDTKLLDQWITAMVEDGTAMDELAEDMADELEDVLEDDPKFREQLIDAVMANEVSREKLIQALVKELS
jgi:hypothetical protein